MNTTSAQRGYDLPVGTRVHAYPGTRDGYALVTRTRTPVWELEDRTPVVTVVGYPGAIALAHIDVIVEAPVLQLPRDVTAQAREVILRTLASAADTSGVCCEECVAEEREMQELDADRIALALTAAGLLNPTGLQLDVVAP